MSTSLGPARGNDIVPNGPIVPLPNLNLPGSITLSDFSTYGNCSTLKLIATSTWSISTIGVPTAGVQQPASAVSYEPVNGLNVVYFSGDGVLSATLYTTVNR